MRKPNFSLDIFLMTHCHFDINKLKCLLINFNLTKIFYFIFSSMKYIKYPFGKKLYTQRGPVFENVISRNKFQSRIKFSELCITR